MAKAVVGLFPSREQAEDAIRALADGGFARDHIGILSPDDQNRPPAIGPVHELSSDRETGRDTFIGGLAGLVAGIVALAIPGIGPVIAAGPLAGALGGLTLGATAGVIVGKLRDYGIPEDEVELYAEGVRRGGTVVGVLTDSDDAASRATKVLEEHGAADVKKREQEWRASGWKGYDVNAQPEWVRRAG